MASKTSGKIDDKSLREKCVIRITETRRSIATLESQLKKQKAFLEVLRKDLNDINDKIIRS